MHSYLTLFGHQRRTGRRGRVWKGEKKEGETEESEDQGLVRCGDAGEEMEGKVAWGSMEGEERLTSKWNGMEM